VNLMRVRSSEVGSNWDIKDRPAPQAAHKDSTRRSQFAPNLD
jgi:hypothetical protein